ncbi:MAG: hypothetical protein ACTSVZ_03580 [Promethearchaeota archaeon]
MIDSIRKLVDPQYLRDVPGWFNAPVPVCMGGDYRALSFCCKPGSSLTFGYKCRRDERLMEIGMTPEEFIRIKQEYSTEHDWDSKHPCFGSISYCCMRQSGCSHRDAALKERYPEKSYKEALEEYFRLKKILAKEILQQAKNKEVVVPFLD